MKQMKRMNLDRREIAFSVVVMSLKLRLRGLIKIIRESTAYHPLRSSRKTKRGLWIVI